MKNKITKETAEILKSLACAVLEAAYEAECLTEAECLWDDEEMLDPDEWDGPAEWDEWDGEELEEYFGPAFKRMMYLPDGTVLFLTVEESDMLLNSYQEMGIIPLFDGISAIFDEEHVAEHEGRRYIAGPVIIRTDMDPMFETDLAKEEILEIFQRLEANEEMIRFGGVDIPVLALR